jgi:hypothetical protein
MNTCKRWLILGVLLAALGGCVQPAKTDYRVFVAHMPRSILVLPPLNNTANVRASDAFLATVTQPLADCGYYVYPIAVVDRLFKDNGVPTPGDMHSISLAKIGEIIGPDAVMYITIKTWTTTYVVIDSSTIVHLAYKLVDAETGQVLWERDGEFRQSSSAGQSDIFAAMIAAGIQAISSAASEGKAERDVAVMANFTTFNDAQHGLLRGPRSPGFSADQKRIQAVIAKEEAQRTAGKS